MGLVRDSRCIRFAVPNERWAAELRGLVYFRGLRGRYTLRRLLGAHGRVKIVDYLGGGMCWDEVLFIVTPGEPGIAEHLEYRATRPHLATVVDMTADILGLMSPTPAMVEAGRATRPQAWEYWADAAHLDSLMRCLRAADVVTTPWADLVEPLADVCGRPVLHLPDLQPGIASARQFATNLARVLAALPR